MRGRIYHTFVEFGACGGWRTEVDRTRRNRCPQGGTLKANTTWRERTKIQGMRRPKSRTIVMLELDSSVFDLSESTHSGIRAGVTGPLRPVQAEQ